MADMKLDEAKLRASIREVAEEAQARLSERIRESVEEVGQVARALRDTPDNMLKLFETAAVAQVAEVEYTNRVELQDVTIHTNHHSSRIGRFESHPQPVPAGKYRALFFLVKVEDGDKVCEDCGAGFNALMVKDDHHGGQKTVCVDRNACHLRSAR